MTKKKLKHKKAFKRALDDLDVGSFVSTQDETLKWFNLLNHAVFGGKVPLPQFNIKSIRYQAWCSAYDKAPFFKITLRTRYRCEKHFVQAIAHEMVHVIQYIETDDMNHGPYFKAWKEQFKKLAIKL